MAAVRMRSTRKREDFIEKDDQHNLLVRDEATAAAAEESRDVLAGAYDPTNQRLRVSVEGMTVENMTVELDAADDSVTMHGDQGPAKQAPDGSLIVQVANPSGDPASETTLEATRSAVEDVKASVDAAAATQATEATATDIKTSTDAVKTSVDDVKASVDAVASTQATETTLATRASEATLAQVKAAVEAVEAAIEAQPAGGDASNAKLDEIKARLPATAPGGVPAKVEAPNSGNLTQDDNALHVYASVYGRTTDGAAGETGGGSFQGLFQKIRNVLIEMRDAARNVGVSLITGVTNRTTTYTNDQTNASYLAATVGLEVTSIGTGQLKLKIQEKVTSGGTPVYRTLVESAVISADGTYVLRVGPGIKEVANESAAYRLPRDWRIEVEAVNANPTTWNLYRSLTK